VALHAHVQRLHAEQDEEGVERRETAAHVAQDLRASPGGEGGRPERLDVPEAVIADVRLGEAGEAAARSPVEAAAVHQDAADRRTVPAQELGERVVDDVGAVLQRLHQVRAGHRVVHDQRQAGGVGHVGHGADVQTVETRVRDHLGIDELGARGDGGAEGFGVGAVDEGDVDAQSGQRLAQQGVRATVERRRRHHVVTGGRQREHAGGEGGLPAGEGHRGHPALKSGHALLKHGHRRVGDARVDVAFLLQREQLGGVVAVAEDERGRLVDGPGT